MIAKSMIDSVSNGVTAVIARLLRSRRAMRAPIWIYRAGLGFVFGSRLILLEHIGRRTGARRLVVLEVVGHPTPDTFVVASGFGDRSQWYRNIEVNPHVRVWVARHTAAPAEAHPMAPEQAESVMNTYIARHQRAWPALKPVLESTLGEAIGDDGSGLPLVRLQLRQSP